eukprot:CAMPEP_0204240680 /NCGR_PEP_ID=MMETSP0361-20130328/95005_1 /ASSEMBLY_ACC=CAM_ASM_000343 /TAXON_ID=268821 /ORGANISM="Scrippsiella Hangoei, Strain SHTV-5" /LENGTH=154 /DNA_ID=CAMNT_0051213483 /DNA_START=239 /DNA_END=703 /DNA_ORIENTATION=-
MESALVQFSLHLAASFHAFFLMGRLHLVAIVLRIALRAAPWAADGHEACLLVLVRGGARDVHLGAPGVAVRAANRLHNLKVGLAGGLVIGPGGRRNPIALWWSAPTRARARAAAVALRGTGRRGAGAVARHLPQAMSGPKRTGGEGMGTLSAGS